MCSGYSALYPAVFGFDRIFFFFSAFDDFWCGFAVSNWPQRPPPLTLKMTTAQVVETSDTVTSSSFQNYTRQTSDND